MLEPIRLAHQLVKRIQCQALIILYFATKCKELNAAVIYYGRNPDPLDSVQNIPCPVLGNYGEDDPNIMPGVEPLKAVLTKHEKGFDIKIYPGAKHAFNNNTNPDRYHPEAARDAGRGQLASLKGT